MLDYIENEKVGSHILLIFTMLGYNAALFQISVV